MREVVIVSAVRTAVGKAYKGTLRATRPDDLGAVAIGGALARVPQLDVHEIEDVILGCAMPEAEQGMNVARIAVAACGAAGGNLGNDDQPFLLVRIAGDRDCRRSHCWRAERRSSSPAARSR